MRRFSKAELDALRASGEFDAEWYLNAYPDVRALGMDPLEHYLWIGARLGRGPTRSSKRDDLGSRIAGKRDFSSPPPPPDMRAGALIPVPLDAKGRRRHPARRHGDGRRLASFALDRDHFWYRGHALDAFLDDAHNVTSLPDDVRRILVISYDFVLQTGVTRSLAHYLNAITAFGGRELTSLELAPKADFSVVNQDVDVHDFVIVNSLAPLVRHDGAMAFMRRCGPGKAVIYLHETEWAFEKSAQEHPERFKEFVRALPEFNVLCVSRRQQRWLREEFGVTRSVVVNEVSTLPEPAPPGSLKEKLDPDSPLQIVMAGTIQPRKGPDLFSRVADMVAEVGLPWRFRWAGKPVGRDPVYQSSNVEWVGNLDGAAMFDFVTGADIFFLSSVDDPFPLCVLEALQANKRAVVYRKTGVSEIFEGEGAPAGVVFDEYAPEAAFAALRKAAATRCSAETFGRIQRSLSVPAFVSRMNSAIAEFYEPPQTRIAPPASARQTVAAVVHLYYHDLWPEIRSYLENLRHINADLYVTLTTDKPREELDRMRAKILRSWPRATVLDLPNRGMDAGAFVEVARYIHKAGRTYDLILKLHSKKSLSVSGEENGGKWRRELYDGLVGTVSIVERILSIFADHPQVGMIGPTGMILEKTSNDVAEQRIVNAPKINLLSARMGLSDRKQKFFRGTMFWARAKEIIAPIVSAGLTIDDFEDGHAPDGTLAHAMERVFACMIRSRELELFEFDPDLPKPIRLLKNRHKDEDIYIIAAGASAGHVDPAFFRGKCVIGVNRVFVRFPCTYVIQKEYGDASYERELLASQAKPVIAQWDSGNIRQGKMRRNTMLFKRPEYYFFEHLENTREVVDLSVIHRDSDKLVVSYSTITSAMHLAAYMGAKNIILVGHDCGLLDGKATFEGYYRDMSISPWKSIDEYKSWLSIIESQSLEVRDKIRKVFGCNVVSINPFINLGLEGRRYVR